MNADTIQRMHALRAAQRHIQPDAAWVHATRETLVMQVRNSFPANPPSVTERFISLFSRLLTNSAFRSVYKPVATICASTVFMLFMLGGSLMSVSAAEHALPGDFLYGLKLVTEQARLAWVSGTEEKLKLKTEFTERRVNELQQVAGLKKEPERLATVTEILKRDFHTLKQQLADVTREASAEKAVAAAKLVDRKTNAVIHALQAAKADLPSATKEKVTEIQSVAAETSVKAIEVLVAKHAESQASVSVGDVTQAIQDHTKLVANVTQTDLPQTTSTSKSSLSLQSAVTLKSSHSTATPATTVVSSSTTSSTLPDMVIKMKAMSLQAFALQKVKELLESGTGFAASGTSPDSAPGAVLGNQDKGIGQEGRK